MCVCAGIHYIYLYIYTYIYNNSTTTPFIYKVGFFTIKLKKTSKSIEISFNQTDANPEDLDQLLKTAQKAWSFKKKSIVIYESTLYINIPYNTQILEKFISTQIILSNNDNTVSQTIPVKYEELDLEEFNQTKKKNEKKMRAFG